MRCDPCRSMVRSRSGPSPPRRNASSATPRSSLRGASPTHRPSSLCLRPTRSTRGVPLPTSPRRRRSPSRLAIPSESRPTAAGDRHDDPPAADPLSRPRRRRSQLANPLDPGDLLRRGGRAGRAAGRSGLPQSPGRAARAHQERRREGHHAAARRRRVPPRGDERARVGGDGRDCRAGCGLRSFSLLRLVGCPGAPPGRRSRHRVTGATVLFSGATIPFAPTTAEYVDVAARTATPLEFAFPPHARNLAVLEDGRVLSSRAGPPPPTDWGPADPFWTFDPAGVPPVTSFPSELGNGRGPQRRQFPSLVALDGPNVLARTLVVDVDARTVVPAGVPDVTRVFGAACRLASGRVLLGDGYAISTPPRTRCCPVPRHPCCAGIHSSYA